jgi:hypothetical protein
MAAYAKNEKENLTKAERNEIVALYSPTKGPTVAPSARNSAQRGRKSAKPPASVTLQH